MIIVSQDEDLIINFNNVTVIGIAQNNPKEIDSITTDGEEQYLGEYKTEERAKEVLQEIITTYTTKAVVEYNGYISFEMPKE
jgi:hypothetical protein